MNDAGVIRTVVSRQRLGAVALVASVFLGLLALALLWTVDFLVGQVDELPSVALGLPVQDLEAYYNVRLEIIGVILALFAAGAVVALLVWQAMAHHRLRSFGLGARFGPVLALLCWFVPGVNLVGPALAMRELWRLPDPDTDIRPGRGGALLVWVWWVLVVVAVALGARGLAAAPLHGGTPDQLISRDGWWNAACSVGIVASVVWIFLVQLTTGRLDYKEDQVRFPGWEAWTETRRVEDGDVADG
jgi:hypothetical protein